MENDPIYLSQAITCKASLGVLLVAENVCRYTLAKKLGDVKLWLAFGLEDFSSLCKVEEERFESIDEVLKI